MPDTPVPIPFSKPEITSGDIAAVTAVLESGWLTTGRQAQLFEAELADYLGIDHVVTASSCTTAEEICIAFLDLPPGSKVAVPTWTFVSSALAAERLGHEPVLVDVDPNSLNICPDSLLAALEQGVDLVVGVHFAGTAFSSSIRKLCADFNVPLIEDAAHALGTRDDRGLVSGKGTAGACYSFYATKNLATAEGGAIATDNEDLANFARTFRQHGMSANAIDRYAKPGAHRYDVHHPGIKANFPDILAALGRSQLARFEKSQTYRRTLVDRYRTNLVAADLRLLPVDQDFDSADHLMVADFLSNTRRDAVIARLSECEIGTSVHFRPLHTFAHYAGTVAIGPSGLRVADALDGQVASLPLHVNMTTSDVDRVCAEVAAALG